MKQLSAIDFQRLFEYAPGLYLVLSPGLTIVGVSEKYLCATRTNREEILDRCLFNVFPDNPDDTTATGVNNLKHSLNRVFKSGKPHELRCQRYDIPRPDGSFEERYWNFLNTPILDESNEVEFIILQAEDTTGLRQHREKEEEEFRNNATLIQHVSEAIIVTDSNYLITAWNRFAEELYGWCATEAIGKHVVSLLHVVYPLNKEADIVEEYRRKGYWKGEVVHHNKEGRALEVIVTASQIKDCQERITGVLLIVRNVTEQKKLERELRKLNQHLSQEVRKKTAQLTSVFERITDGFIGLDSNHNYIYVNKRVGELLHKDPDELIGRNVWDVWPQAIGSDTYHALYDAQKNQRYICHTIHAQILNKWLELHIYPSEDGLSLFVHDVTGRKKMEETLRTVEHTKALIMNSTLEAIVCIDLNDRITLWNSQAEKIFGWSETEIKGQTLAETIIPERYREQHIKGFARYLATGEKTLLNKMIEISALNREGKEFPVQMTVISIKENEEEFFCAFIHDITVRKEAENKLRKSKTELRRSRDELRELASHLQTIREEEQKRIAREIHDELGQQMTGIKMDVSWLEKRINSDKVELHDKLKEMTSLTDSAIQSIRKISSRLRPKILDDLGLIAALQWHSSEFQKRFFIPVTLNIPQDELNISPDMATGLFRLYQESLTNIARHAEASQINAFLRIEGHELILRITDNGKGFDISQNTQRKTLGLLGMTERTLMMEGKLNIESKPGKGTTVTITVPYER